MIETLLKDGWMIKAPSSEAEAIDGEIAASEPCEVCAGQMTYIPLVKAGHYIALAVCNGCGAVVEF